MTAELLPALALAVSAGAIAAFNPCGFAMLPAYLALFLGEPAGRRAAVGRALGVGAAVTVGFVLVFGIAGMLISFRRGARFVRRSEAMLEKNELRLNPDEFFIVMS